MKNYKYLIAFLLLGATVPWPFLGTHTQRIFLGFPLWALYVMVMTCVYTVYVGFLLQSQWKEEGQDDNRYTHAD